MCVLNCLFVCLLFISVSSKDCYWSSKDPYTYFSTKTPYDAVRGDLRDEEPLEGCTLTSLWAIVRHGTRHPVQSDGRTMKNAMTLKDAIVSNQRAGRGDMCAQDISDLANWSWDDSLESTWGYLTQEGHQELLHLGQRVRQRFSPFLDELDSFQFRPTETQRTRESTKAFVEGLGDTRFTIEDPLPDGQDLIIRPYKACERYTNDTQYEMKKAVKKFRTSNDYQQVLANVRQRLALPDLSPTNVSGLYDLCRYFRAYTVDKRHPWCSVFRNEDLKVLEYMEDLGDHYQCGYVSPYAAKLGALPLKNLLENLEEAVNGSHRVTAFFSHDTMIEMIITALGLHHDYPAINSLEVDRERKWRTSLIAPFASNIIVVLNKCMVDDVYSYKVQLFMNEKIVPLCGEQTCAWADFREKLLPFTDSNLEFCKE